MLREGSPPLSVLCPVSHVTCYVPCDTCHVSSFTCLFLIVGQSGESNGALYDLT